jgi:adenylate cyclase
VIGTAVNEASRIESLCDQLDRNLLISDSFVSALGDAAVRPDDCELMSLGSHSLRGVSGQREIYGIAEKAPLQDR